MTQPTELPRTLPIGTRTRYGNEATSELVLHAHAAIYEGHFIWSGTLYVEASYIDWDLVAVQAATPIQAGDWVECVDTGTFKRLESGARYLVKGVGKLSDGITTAVDIDGTGINWLISRFKRVDGPHPVEAADPRESWPPCRDCGGSVHPGASGPGGVCGKCAVKVKPDPYTAHRLNEEARSMDRRKFPNAEKQLQARARNEAALRREAERPMGNPAERKSLAAGHPASWPSVGDDEP